MAAGRSGSNDCNGYSAAVSRRPLALPLTGLLLAALSIVGTQSADAAPKPLTTAQLVAQSVSAANTSGSMHFVDRSTAAKIVTTLSGAVSAPAAAEALSGTGQPPLQVILVNGTAYINAGAQVLQGTLGLPAAAATANAGKWISVQSGDSAFSQIAPQLTISAELNSYVPTSHLHVGKIEKVAGHRVIPVSGRPATSVAKGNSGAVALLISPTAPHLPVGGSLVLSKTGSTLHEVAVFSDWGQKVSVNAPTGAIPFSSLVG